MDKIDYVNTIYDAISDIKFAASNITCVRISVKGNCDFVPNPETISDALFSIECLLDEKVEAIYKAIDEFCEN